MRIFKELYLAEFDLEVTPYLNKPNVTHITRLVWGEDLEDVRSQLYGFYDRTESNGDSYSLHNFEIHTALGTP